MAIVKFTILIPLAFNDGSRVPEEMLQDVFVEFFALADGYTAAGHASGAYRMKDGSKKLDETIIVWIAIDEEKEDRLRSLVADIAHRLGQESIYFERAAATIEFVPPLGPGAMP